MSYRYPLVDPDLKKVVDPYLDKFFKKRLITSFATIKNYKYMVYKFFRILETTPDEYFKRKNLDKSEEELIQIYHDLNENAAAPYSIKGFFNAVKQFLCTTDKEYKTLDFWDTLAIRLRDIEGVSDELVPNRNDLKKILSHADTLQRALFLIQASTGMRIAELCGFKINDVKTNEDPIRIRIVRTFDPTKQNKTKLFTKNKKKRNCFLTEEATEAYFAWMKERDSWLKASMKISHFYKPSDDDRVFPMNTENARRKWNLLIKKAGYDQKDDTSGIRLVHPHCLRKYFRSYLGNSDLAEQLMGHAQGMTKHYRDMKLEDLAKEYKEYSKNIAIFQVNDFSEVNESLKEKDERIKELEKRMDEMKAQITELRLEKLERINGIKK